MAQSKEVYLDEDPIKVPGCNYAVISFLTPKGPQKCDTFGVKIRGSFDTYDQANAHAQRLAKLDSAFDIYVVDCYRWLTAAPDPNLLDKKVYNNPTLNTLMESYQQEQERAKQLFEERKAKVMAEGLEAVEETLESPDPDRERNNDNEEKDKADGSSAS